MPTLSSLPARARALALSLTCPQTVRTNRDTGLIRLLACLFMLVDHAGKMLFPDIPEMRLIGRLAFPMFAYGVAVGAVYTRNPVRYLSRMVLLMLISQPLYALGLDHACSAMYVVPFLEHPLSAFAHSISAAGTSQASCSPWHWAFASCSCCAGVSGFWRWAYMCCAAAFPPIWITASEASA